jgi:hypothetical protein
MKRYVFTVYLWGEGETEEQAWDNAVEAFDTDPGYPDKGDIREAEPEDHS